jgi:hypothetical protein
MITRRRPGTQRGFPSAWVLAWMWAWGIAIGLVWLLGPVPTAMAV